jgi:hypothetical protein
MGFSSAADLPALDHDVVLVGDAVDLNRAKRELLEAQKPLRWYSRHANSRIGSPQLGCRTMLPDFPFRLQPVIHVVSVHAAALFKEFIGALGDPPVQIVRG